MADSPVRALKRRLVALAVRLWNRPRLGADQLLALRPADILIVRQHNQMGDMVCATPALRAIRETWPDARLHLVTSPVNGAVVAHHPDLARVLTFSQKMWRRPWTLARFIRDLRRPRCELAFILGSVSFSITSAAIALAGGARWIVGPDSRPYGWDLSRRLFAVELPASPVVDRHAVLHNLAPLQAVGIDTRDRSTVVVPSAAEREEARRVMADLGLRPGFWALHPGAGKRQNIWPVARFAAVARRAAAAGHQVLVMRGPADAEVVREMFALLAEGPGEQIVAAPLLPVGACAALLEQADRYLGNDTGMMHVAGALQVPSVALFGPTDPDLWKPPSEAVVALRSPRQSLDARGGEFGWMENLDVDTVWEAWAKLPGRTTAASRGGEKRNA